MWAPYLWYRRAVTLLGELVAHYGAVNHASGIWTPLDAGWGQVYHLVL